VSADHLDVLIVGAGLSGVGAACHLRRECPELSFAVVEARSASGGTWDLFRYPGIRSDSDMFTLGYRFRPWPGVKALADGPSILGYIRETASEHGVEPLIRYRRRVVRADWSSARARWSVELERTDTGESETLTCSFLYANTGYYRYDEGYTPQLPGIERFQGAVVHPQHWPEDLDYSGRRVVVIGSGATAITLVPAMAGEAGHVTMLQRSPSYVLSLPAEDRLAATLRRQLPPRFSYAAVRARNILVALLLYKVCRRAPRLMSRLLRRGVAAALPDGYDVERHFKPRYGPWDQRMCFVPDGDLFEAIASGRASVVTDEIETFTERGLLLRSGEELEADVVVTATGLNLLMLGGIALTVDGREVDPGKTVAYRGMMLCGVPNMAFTVGYTNASWTLKADLVAEYVCRLLRHMRAGGLAVCTPRSPAGEQPLRPVLDLSSGYVMRSLEHLPKQAEQVPWRLHQNYVRDIALLRRSPIEDGVLELSTAAREAPHAAPIAA
jgi:cation diffusion facilitator CzcD-associated flavoprotein CzcO